MVVCQCTKPLYLVGKPIAEPYFAVFGKLADSESTNKWFFPLFATCPSASGATFGSVTLTLPNGLTRAFWYINTGDPEETSASTGSPDAPKEPIPGYIARKCKSHKTLSSSEYLHKQKKRSAFVAAHCNKYSRCPMGYTDCYNVYSASRAMCIEE